MPANPQQEEADRPDQKECDESTDDTEKLAQHAVNPLMLRLDPHGHSSAAIAGERSGHKISTRISFNCPANFLGLQSELEGRLSVRTGHPAEKRTTGQRCLRISVKQTSEILAGTLGHLT
jgi:hypothetical protein